MSDDEPPRTLEQLRTEASWHEAGHAAAALILGRTVQSASILADAHSAGRVFHSPGADSLRDSFDDVVIGLAGEAAVALGVVRRWFTAEEVASIEVQMNLEERIAASGKPPEVAAMAFAWNSSEACATDMRNAVAVVEMLAEDPYERVALMGYLQARCATITRSALFASLCSRISEALLRDDEIDERELTYLLEAARLGTEEGGTT